MGNLADEIIDILFLSLSSFSRNKVLPYGKEALDACSLWHPYVGLNATVTIGV